MGIYSVSILFLDFESYSEVDLRKCGADNYARHESTRALMLGWSIDDGPSHVWDISAHPPGARVNDELLTAYSDPNVLKIAHNAPFDMAIMEHALKWPVNPQEWRCSRVLAYSMGFTGGLGSILKAVGFAPDTQKDKGGHRLIMRFCKRQPKNHKTQIWTRENSPVDWAKFIEYCRQDITTLRALWTRLVPYNSMDDYEWGLWFMDREINRRGLPIDIDLVHDAVESLASEKEKLSKALKAYTGLENTSRDHLLAWLNVQRNYMKEQPLSDLQKTTKQQAYDTTESPRIKEALRMSLLIAQASSGSKWNALSLRSHGGVIRDTLQFAGAGRTRRWAGRGLQLQNLKWSPKNMDELIGRIRLGVADMGEITSCIRGAIMAPPGKMLVVSDLSSIESRVVGWLTNCKRLTTIFKSGGDAYIDLAAEIFNTPHTSISKEQRTFAKPAALGCAYQLGGKGLKMYADSFGVEMKESVAQRHVDAFRTIYPEIPGFWFWLKDVIFFILERGPGPAIEGYNLSIFLQGEYLRIQLPSGRCLNYFLPKMEMRPAPWDKGKLIPAFTYMGTDQYTTQWCRISAHMGGVCENIVQAIARDIMSTWLCRVNAMRNIDIIGHVHDEVITLASESMADPALDYINRSIRENPEPWYLGLPLNAEGYISNRYRKD